MMLWTLMVLVLILMGLGMVAFVTLLERKILGLAQIRLGPNKVTLLGLLQPLADGIKLLTKQIILLTSSQFILFLFSPSILLGGFLLAWVLIVPWNGGLFLMKLNSMFLFSLLGIGAYGIMLSGWSVNSIFSKLGAFRGMLQSLSFEVALIMIFLMALGLLKSFFLKSSFYLTEALMLWSILWLLLSLMESNRAPFDLMEGESELISGFNLEMGSFMFVFLFLSEYGMLVVMAVITNIFLTGEVNIVGLVMYSLLLAIRSCFPRVRYDTMMTLMWQSILPVSLTTLILFVLLF